MPTSPNIQLDECFGKKDFFRSLTRLENSEGINQARQILGKDNRSWNEVTDEQRHFDCGVVRLFVY